MEMDVKVDGKRILLDYTLKDDETFKINDKGKIFSLSIYKKPQIVRGITSMCEDGKHCLFLDYDNICRWIVENEITQIAEFFAPFYLFKTKEEKVDGQLVGNYHAISLRKCSPKEIVDIHNKTSCDKAYTTMPLRNRFRSWVLRMSDKKGSGAPEFVKVISGVVDAGQFSSAHLKVLQELYPEIPYIDYMDNLDKLTKLYVNEYETAP